MRPRPVLHETEAETKTNYCETETKKVVLRPRWSRDLNIPDVHRPGTLSLQATKPGSLVVGPLLHSLQFVVADHSL